MKTTALITVAASLVASPVAAQQRCISSSEAEAMTLVALPEIIRQTGVVCTTQLPSTSIVRRASSPLLDRYETEATRAWPTARAAIVKLSDPAVDALLGSDFARPLLTTLLVPQLVGRIAVSDCGTIDRLVTLLEPLPPRNTAGIVVATLQYLKAEKAKGSKIEVPEIPLCPARNR